jgi:arabinan endo-1,5-alpha-L-arabinosidase
MKYLFSLFFLMLWCNLFAQTKSVINDTLIPVHDPVIIREDSTYYIFCTGQGITGFSSNDMKHWKQLKPVFDKAPAWAVKTIPGFSGHIWAPDISYHNGQYYLEKILPALD